MARRPRVLLVAPHFAPETVAAAVRLDSLARHLASLGHEVSVIAPGSAGGAPESRGSVRRVPVADRGHGGAANAAWQIRLGLALARGVRAGPRCDVALVSSPPPLAALLAARAAAARGLPVVVDLRDLWPDVLVEAGALGEWSPAAAALRVVERRLLGTAAALVTVTEGKRRRMAGRFAGEIVVAPNGVDEAWLADAPPYGDSTAGSFVAVAAGNIGVAQDVGLFVRALASLPPGSAVRGLVLGDGEERDAVARLAARLASPVDFEPPIPRAEVRRRLVAAGCAVVTLRSADLADSVPSKLLEAMALGVPAVLVAAGEAAALARESGGCVVVAPGDAAGLARALVELAQLPAAERRLMGARGRAFVLAHHRRERSAEIVSQLLQRIVPAGSHAAR